MQEQFNNDIIEDILQQYSGVTGRDHAKYRNHVYRVYLHCLLIDTDKKNEVKYAIAAAYHDIGLWTANTLDYLGPSIEEARKYLAGKNLTGLGEEIVTMINWHHKTSAYTKEFALTTETFRKADWIDVSLGIIKYGCKRKDIRRGRILFPRLGFHRFLVGRIFKNLFIHPLRPLPMFRR